MANFKAVLPDEVIAECKKIFKDTDKIFGEMTRAGAEVVAGNVKTSTPIPAIAPHVQISKTYRTPSDDGINTKVYFNGYLPFKGSRRTFVRRGRKGGGKYTTNKGIPAAFLAQVTEYGTTDRFTDADEYRGKIRKQPFFRKSFNRAEIEHAMLQAQKKASGGILDE